MSFIDYLDEVLGPSKEANNQTRYNCPFCSPNTDYKLYVNTSGDSKDSLWMCFKCSSAGNPITFAMQYNNEKYADAKNTLDLYIDTEDTAYRKQGLTDAEILYLKLLQKNEQEPRAIDERYSPPPLPVGLKLIEENLNNPEVRPFVDYLINKRHLDAKDIITHRIGYVVDGYAYTSLGKKVVLKNHIIFFIFGDSGEYLYWTTRSIDPNSYRKSYNGFSTPEQYSKSKVVFNLNRAKHLPEVVICEGIIDALTVGPQGVATLGKKVSKYQIDQIVSGLKEDQVIYIMLDKDASKETENIADKLYQKHRNTYIVINPKNRDANDMGREKTWELIKNSSIPANSPKRFMLYLT